MRLAVIKQKNISMDIKKGISELDELLDVIDNHRRSWKIAENEQKARKLLRIGNRAKAVISEKDGLSTQNKRSASSPAQDDTSKKYKGDEKEEDWQTVQNRRKRNRKEQTLKPESATLVENERTSKRKFKSDAMLVRPKEGYTYAEVLRTLRSKVNPEESNINIKTVRKTRNGEILLELEKGEKINSKLSNAIKSTLLDTAETLELTPKTAIEIRDLDSLTTCDEVTEAIRSVLKKPEEVFKVSVSAPNNREQKRAVVNMSSENADLLLKNNKIKIGWINCRMRLYSGIQRCYKCLSPGHTQWQCRGPDRRNLCIRCGGTNHKIKDCGNKPNCCLCTEKGLSEVEHIAGSSKCSASVKRQH